MPELAAENLACLRGERIVFARLGFVAGPGDALVLLGPNGSGKSSLLRLLAGFGRPFHGRLLWDGDEDAARLRGAAAYVGHLDAVKPVLTAAEMLAFWAALGGAPDPAAAAAAALDRMGIAHVARVPGRYLSAGQKRRVNLARLVCTPRPLWLLDEPTVALDRDSVGRVEEMVADHRRAGGIAVVSTHADIDLPGAGALHLDAFGVDGAAAPGTVDGADGEAA
ncbi:MAG TPA: heme ABC exporter ATP-binding protein CcmA [Azospirillaceae bacterium]|nr:heme ABC exporter ATP-binding protein CcmA [Azospirillaceae bacterium]